jgi:hypothetical protein
MRINHGLLEFFRSHGSPHNLVRTDLATSLIVKRTTQCQLKHYISDLLEKMNLIIQRYKLKMKDLIEFFMAN